MGFVEDLSEGVSKGLLEITGHRVGGKDRKSFEYSFEDFKKLRSGDLKRLVGKEVTITNVTCLLEEVFPGKIPKKAKAVVDSKKGIDDIATGREAFNVKVASVMRVFNGKKLFGKEKAVEELSLPFVVIAEHLIGQDSRNVRQAAMDKHVEKLRGSASLKFVDYKGEHMPLGSITVSVRELGKSSLPKELSSSIKEKKRFFLEIHKRTFHDSIRPEEGMKRVEELHRRKVKVPAWKRRARVEAGRKV